ncbi:P-loop NTPase fold protein [Enterobacter mori]
MEARHAGNFGPITGTTEDSYGYDSIADSLARRILTLDKGSSQVFGIEGKWGSGKTSLLNLLMQHLNMPDQESTHVLPVSPWLSPPEAR